MLETGVTVAHKYDEPGDYTVIMTIRDDDGAQKEGYLYITVTGEEGMISGSGAMLALAAGVAAIVILVLAVFILRRAGMDEDEEALTEEDPIDEPFEDDERSEPRSDESG